MNVRAACGRLRKARPTDVVAYRLWHAPAASLGAPLRWVWRSWRKSRIVHTGHAFRFGKGGGRKKASLKDPNLVSDLEKLLEPVTRGDPQSPLRWTCRSVRNLADE